jgi:acetyltransferase-like isoleucine patch superfamily enzyme
MVFDVSGRIKRFLMTNYLRRHARSFGKNNNIHHSLIVKDVEKLSIGNNCHFDEYVILRAKSDLDIGINIGDNVTIKANAYISSNGGQIIIRDNAGIGHHVWIGGKGKIIIGNYAIIGGYSYIISSNHNYTDRKMPYSESREMPTIVTIGNNVWVGAHCIFLPEVSIGENSVVGAGSVVTRNIPKNCLAFGTPATVKKQF